MLTFDIVTSLFRYSTILDSYASYSPIQLRQVGLLGRLLGVAFDFTTYPVAVTKCD